MQLLSQVLIGLVALIQVYILWLDMFAWTTRGPKTFRSLRPELFAPTKVLAANQGLYNGFLAAGLLWALLITDPDWHRNVACFFLGCVAVAGVYGALTAGPRILLVQTVPALLALAALQLTSWA
jgi:putative membrane protein